MNINQILSILMVILGVLVASTAQLTDIVGPTATKTVVSIASMLNAMLGGMMAVFTSQTNTVKTVQEMPGVEKIVVNREANSTLANLAVDPAQLKIESKANDETIIQQKANQ